MKKIEKIILFVAGHCSVSAIDNYGEIIQSYVKESILEQKKLSRTKSSCLTCNAINTLSKDKLTAMLKDPKFTTNQQMYLQKKFEEFRYDLLY